ncbi:RIP metalloprotease RseP [Paraflavitalea sp. CAU 1676]|uniref:RIP metalloprotease RseP n=1 Tax=Paraflavitalea sp. CAU 1676 TaxID=3032598 RepID=UPI0023DAA66B|nr:RIP metalloprotease RseP [Paraflavitalea sp. CAU 1676]MDF2190312.1 RIP metalloprotease RseP [Paraflavitalea sp. CAU 1676]
MITILAIDWASVGTKALQLILSLSILVILHEMGHFLPAKWFKCRVEKFYLFFDPWFSLFKKKIGETVYGIGWLPLGGYVKISGMIDESMDKEQMKQAPQPWEFRSKPAWQRLIIMIGGVTVNLLLGFFLFAMILWVWGENRLPMSNLKHGIMVSPISEKVGLKNGDVFVSIDNKPVKDYYSLTRDLILDEGKSVQVNRNGQIINLELPKGTINSLIKSKGTFVKPRVAPIVDTVFSGVGKFTQDSLYKGDQVLAVDSTPVTYYDEYLAQVPKLKSKEVALTVLRGKDTVIVKAKADTTGRIGFYVSTEDLAGSYKQKYDFLPAFPAGVHKGWENLVMNVKNFKLLFTSEEVKASESLGSFLSIGNMFGSQWDWELFWSMTALLSVVLAFMNMLPIPALDGGHVLFTLYEMITGRKPGDKFMEYAQMVGMVLLLGLMAYAIGLDFWRYLFK